MADFWDRYGLAKSHGYLELEIYGLAERLPDENTRELGRL
jgi:hypothetical protein